MAKKNFIERNIDLATKTSRLGVHWQHRVGAVLCKNGNVIGLGHNSFKTHPQMLHKTLHAEVDALVGVKYQDLRGSIMFVSRTSNTGRIGMAKPCSICSEVLRSYGIRKVYYTTSTSIGELRLS